jgi:hypothetical protein
MTPLAPLIFAMTILLWGCSGKNENANHPTSFKSFEISFTNGWAKGFSFFVDTNKIYFSPHGLDTANYGVLPDSIFKIIDSNCEKIQSDTTIKSKDAGCVDCSVAAIKIISKGDTTRINQTGDIDKEIVAIVKSLQKFIDSSRHETIGAVIILETRFVVSPPPAEISTKFKPPNSTK